MRHIIIVILISLNFTLSGQNNDSLIRLQVIKSGKIDSLYVFGKWTQDGQTQTELKLYVVKPSCTI